MSMTGLVVIVPKPSSVSFPFNTDRIAKGAKDKAATPNRLRAYREESTPGSAITSFAAAKLEAHKAHSTTTTALQAMGSTQSGLDDGDGNDVDVDDDKEESTTNCVRESKTSVVAVSLAGCNVGDGDGDDDVDDKLLDIAVVVDASPIALILEYCRRLSRTDEAEDEDEDEIKDGVTTVDVVDFGSLCCSNREFGAKLSVDPMASKEHRTEAYFIITDGG